MPLANVGGMAVTVGWVIALVVFLIAILGLVGVVPISPIVLFGCIAALAVARLL